MNLNVLTPTTPDEVREAVLALPTVRLRGGGTKTALSSGATLSMAGVSGILQYDPSEFTFTALAGTPLATIQDTLATHGQYLPFDPPWSEAGATLGGTVAAGMSGPGRFQYGGVRDFLLGVRLVTGDGRVVRGGGKVVKNAAGFDIPKLLVGSLGCLGVITEASFKVFPAPAATATICASFSRLDEAVAMLQQLASSQLALTALDLEPTQNGQAEGPPPALPNAVKLFLRLSGLSNGLPQRINRVREFLRAGPHIEVSSDDASFWQAAAEFSWAPPEHSLVKVPLVASQIVELEALLATQAAAIPRRYSVGGNVAWIAWPVSLDQKLLEAAAARLQRPLLVVRDTRPALRAASTVIHPLLQKLRAVFDPQNKLA